MYEEEREAERIDKINRIKKKIIQDKETLKNYLFLPIGEKEDKYRQLVKELIDKEDRCNSVFKDDEIVGYIIKMELFTENKLNNSEFVSVYNELKNTKDVYGEQSDNYILKKEIVLENMLSEKYLKGLNNNSKEQELSK